MPERIVTFTGHPGSGKTTSVKLLEDVGFTPIRPQLVMRDYAHEHEVPLGANRSSWAEVRRRINEERGPDWIAQEILSSPASAVVLDALRTVGDYRVLSVARERGLAKVAFVGLFCPPEIRYRHILKSEDFDKPKPGTFEDFLAQETPEYYSTEGEFGMATQAVLELIPPDLKIEYTSEPKDLVGQMIVSRLGQYGYLSVD